MRAPALFLALLALASCDATDPLEGVALRVAISDQFVSFGGVTVPVAPNVATTAEATADGVQGIDGIDDLTALTIAPGDVSFASPDGRASGSIRIVALVNGFPLPTAPIVTIEGGQVADLQPSVVVGPTAQPDVRGIREVVERLPPDARPVLPSDLESLDMNAFRRRLAREFSDDPFVVQLVVAITRSDPAAPLDAGTLTLEGVSFWAIVSVTP
jgi:hypothetical protein